MFRPKTNKLMICIHNPMEGLECCTNTVSGPRWEFSLPKTEETRVRDVRPPSLLSHFWLEIKKKRNTKQSLTLHLHLSPLGPHIAQHSEFPVLKWGL